MRRLGLSEVDEIAFGERWRPQTATPAKGYPTYSAAQAQAMYEGDEQFMLTVVGIVHGDDGPWLGWTMGFSGPDGATAGVRVSWYTRGGAVTGIADYDNIDGRLFRSGSTRYTFPDEVNYYGANESLEMVMFDYKPDGTGVVWLTVREGGEVERRDGTFEGAPVEGLWMDRPAWGEWGQLLDWRYGGAAAEMFDPR